MRQKYTRYGRPLPEYSDIPREPEQDIHESCFQNAYPRIDESTAKPSNRYILYKLHRKNYEPNSWHIHIFPTHRFERNQSGPPVP